jgi:hypothetical protein
MLIVLVVHFEYNLNLVNQYRGKRTFLKQIAKNMQTSYREIKWVVSKVVIDYLVMLE